MTLDTIPKPTPPATSMPTVIVRGKGGRHHVGQVARLGLDAVRPWVELTSVRRLYAWPAGLGLDGLAVAAGDLGSLDGLQLGPAVPRMYVRDVDVVWWTTAAAAAALHAHPDRIPEDPARPLVPELVTADGSGAPLTASATEATRIVFELPHRTVPTPADIVRNLRVQA